MADNTNPYTGTPYNSQEDIDRDLAGHPECKQKIAAFAKRIQEQLNHQQIREICGIWGCVNPGEFWAKFNASSDEELRAVVDRVKGRKKKKLVENSALLTVAAGVV